MGGGGAARASCVSLSTTKPPHTLLLATTTNKNKQTKQSYNYGVDSYDLGAGFGHYGLAFDDVYAACERITKGGGKVRLLCLACVCMVGLPGEGRAEGAAHYTAHT